MNTHQENVEIARCLTLEGQAIDYAKKGLIDAALFYYDMAADGYACMNMPTCESHCRYMASDLHVLRSA